MQILEVIAALDEEIARLKQVRSLLMGAPTSTTQPTTTTNKRSLSAEGRARIIAAQKARWAKSRKK